MQPRELGRHVMNFFKLSDISFKEINLRTWSLCINSNIYIALQELVHVYICYTIPVVERRALRSEKALDFCSPIVEKTHHNNNMYLPNYYRIITLFPGSPST